MGLSVALSLVSHFYASRNDRTAHGSFSQRHTYNPSAASSGRPKASQLDTAGNLEFPDSACLGTE